MKEPMKFYAGEFYRILAVMMVYRVITNCNACSV